MKAVSIDRKQFIPYPTNRVVGTIGDADHARAAIDALLQAGFPRESIDILHSEEDLQRLDPTGAAHGFLAQFHRTLIRTLDLEEFKHLTQYVQAVRAGLFVIMVLTKRRSLRITAAEILHQYGADFVEFYGRWSCEDVPATAQTSPEDIPALFARAWNSRDPAALAVLFDEDADFVSVDGRAWHDRAAIRKWHATRVERELHTSTVITSETKVKLLSSEFAVVHARLTLSDEACPPAAIPPGARTTAVSFVVHRAGEKWMCASAQATHVLPASETGAAEGAGVFGQGSDQVS
ncbi:MAG: hypothetical protein V7647_400 [Acidobacteriota bacterium]|jgi:uncharacterized protein (TIGR02246 family)